MQPQNVPPAPPPIPPGHGHENPYAFLDEHGKRKRSLLPGGNSKKQRVIIVVGGLLVLLVVGFILYSMLTSSASSPKEDLLSLEQQQAELIRVADIGMQKAHQSDTKNFAVTAKYTIISQQGQVAAIAKKAHFKASTKQLQAGKNTKTDSTLTTADQNNQFDQTFTVVYKTQLLNYRRTLEKVRSEMTGTKTRATLKTYDEQIAVLVPDGTAPASQ
jgi:hypothetical protein